MRHCQHQPFLLPVRPAKLRALWQFGSIYSPHGELEHERERAKQFLPLLQAARLFNIKAGAPREAVGGTLAFPST